MDRCPACGSVGLLAVWDGDATNFVCAACGACWHPELGRVWRVDPAGCPGCARRGVCRGLDALPAGRRPPPARARAGGDGRRT